MAAWNVAALYVDVEHGPYPALAADVYGVARDAGTYAGPLPVVAHPPCGPWGRYKARCNQDPQTAIDAVWLVRRWGGVLEHPIGSTLFRHMDIPTGDWDNPERTTDRWGGYTIKAPQWSWGHRSTKDTILYIVGTADLPPLFDRQCATEPRAVERLGKRERRMTPGPMAWWLCNLASRCKVERR